MHLTEYISHDKNIFVLYLVWRVFYYLYIPDCSSTTIIASFKIKVNQVNQQLNKTNKSFKYDMMIYALNSSTVFNIHVYQCRIQVYACKSRCIFKQ